jgi:hypothetical protein
LDDNKQLTGAAAGDGQYSYQFVNKSGYPLNITLGSGPEFIVNAGQSVTRTLPQNEAYFDYYGGNAIFARETGKVTFTDNPESEI